MPRLTESQLRFEIRRCLQCLSRSTLRDMAGKPDAHERGMNAAVESVYERLRRFEVIGPEPEPYPLEGIGNAPRSSTV